MTYADISKTWIKYYRSSGSGVKGFHSDVDSRVIRSCANEIAYIEVIVMNGNFLITNK